jgi:protein-S-isoprenylcysteine O-methyltransferase Ste14
VGAFLYGALFVAVLPAALLVWARGADRWVSLPPIRAPAAGGALAALGLALLGAGMWALRVHGGGLPMNAFPPPRYVARGAYRLVAHPIYVGFCAAVLGVALASGSAAGLWLVFPAVALGCAALVLGHERPDLLRRFGRLERPWLALPPRGDPAPAAGERAAVVALVLVPWAAIYGALATLPVPADAVSTALPLERGWPVLEWSEVVYASTYVGVLAAALLAPTRTALRELAVRGLVAMALVFPLQAFLPLVAPPRPLDPAGALGRLILLERALDTSALAFPSFHVIWALLAADALAPRTRLARPWAAAVALSCLATGAHTVADVAAGIAAWAVVRRGDVVWEGIRRGAERIANGWHAWRAGPARILVHAAWAALSAASGAAVIAAFADPGSSGLVVALFAGVVGGAGLWAQLVEGRAGLSRPFGFYGGLLGGIAVALASSAAAGHSPWPVLGACALAVPVSQGIGRLRCLVQGCCHGAPAPEVIGIRYRTPLSRVVKAGLGGVPVHPTPLYAMAWSALCALVLFRLALAGAPAHAVAGVGLFLGGVGRFVEEACRGEPQTPIVAGLRLYQWLAVASAVAGAAVTALARSGPLPAPQLGATDLAVAAACGLVAAFAMGVDFPGSPRRLSRLADPG